jgi:hypothetical protein
MKIQWKKLWKIFKKVLDKSLCMRYNIDSQSHTPRQTHGGNQNEENKKYGLQAHGRIKRAVHVRSK